MAGGVQGVAKKSEKKDILVIARKRMQCFGKKLAPQLCNDYFPQGSKTRSVISCHWLNTACKFATGTPLQCLSKKYVYHNIF
jgi:hypothetical protein